MKRYKCPECGINYGNKIKTRKDMETEKGKGAKYSAINGNARNIMKHLQIDKVCKNCGYNKHVEVCHIKAVSSFEDDDLVNDINSVNNLVYLCPNCHWEFDYGTLNLANIV